MRRVSGSFWPVSATTSPLALPKACRSESSNLRISMVLSSLSCCRALALFALNSASDQVYSAFRMPCGLVAAWAAQHERFEGGHTAVWTRYVVVGDLDRGEVAALRPGIDGECGEAVGVGRVSHRRPGRVLLHVDRRTLACCRVGFADGGDHATLRRVEKQLVRWQGRSAAADHHVHRSFSGVDHVGGSARRYRRQSEI